MWYNIDMQKIIKNEAGMRELGEEIARELALPFCVELRGDVGAGKTTLTRGIAKGLGATEAVTSPSFTISKRYVIDGGELVHYDFYRLDEPGLMADDLYDSLSDEKTGVIVEWGEEVAGVLPENRIIVTIKLLANGEREVKW